MNRKTVQTSPDQPWQSRNDWAAGMVKSSDSKHLFVSWFFMLVWNAISIPIAFLLPGKIQGTGDQILYLFFLFPAVGAFLALAAVRATIRFSKFGASTFRMLSVPGEIGGHLSGVIETKTKLDPENGFHLSLRCIQRVTTGHGKNSRTEEHVLWEDKKVVREMMQSEAHRSGIPVFFEIPGKCSPTSSPQNISWRLKAEAAVPGVDFKTDFEVPVFETSSEKKPFNSAAFAAHYEKPVDMSRELSATGIEVRPAMNGMEFYFPAARNKAMGALTLICFFGAVAGLMFAIVLKAAILVLFVAMVFAGAFGFAVFEFWFKSRRLIANPDGLTIDVTYLGLKRTRHIPPENILALEVKAGSQAANITYYDVHAMTREKNIILGSGIKGRKEADWLAGQIEAALKEQRTR